MDAIRAETVIGEVERKWGSTCAGCSVRIVGHEVVLSMFLGLKDAPRCANCLAALHRQEAQDFLRRAAASIRRLDCYRAGWLHSEDRLRREGAWPHERFPSDIDLEREPDASSEDPGRTVARAIEPRSAADFDAGDMACGDLVLELRLRMRELSAGEVLRVRATDPGAPQDLPAWCRVTGHDLVRQETPRYWIRRRTDPP